VRRYAARHDSGGAILTNRFYRNISGALSGTQEYMAGEKLFELHDETTSICSGRHPPTRNALDFLDAPADSCGS